jgi:peroxiredoxin
MKTILSLWVLLALSPCKAQTATDATLQKELDKLHTQVKAIRDSLAPFIKSNYEELQAATDPAKFRCLKSQEDSLYKIADQNDIDELKINLAFAKKHPSSLYCLELVQPQVGRQPGKNFYDDFVQVYNNAAPQIQQSATGVKMSEQLKYFKQSKIGSVAPLFSGKDVWGNKIALADYQGKKYVLVDFWASSCAPCREEFPYMKEIYARYKELGFEVISISTDDDTDRWRRAIEKDGTGMWKHFSIAENNSSVAKDYFVNGIPHMVLIDKSGIIIGKWKGSGGLNRADLETQLREVLK